MAAPKQYRVRTRPNSDGSTTFYARFTDQHGIRREFPLGRTPQWNLRRAEQEMRHIQADVERGRWSARKTHNTDPQRLLFEEMAPAWWNAKVALQTARRTQNAYKAELDNHLKPFFGEMAVASITKQDVDDFVQAGVRDGLSPAYINSQVQLLGRILDLAMDWHDGILPANPARGAERRLAYNKRRHDDEWLGAAHVEVLLRAAELLDQSATREAYRHFGREALVACLCFAGVRNTELCELRWADIDFQRRIIRVRGTKTQAASREVNIVDGLLPRLVAHQKQTLFPGQRDPVWPTATGKHRDKDSMNRRIIQRVVTKARDLIAADEEKGANGAPRELDVVLPSRITPHTFRRTFCAFATEEAGNPFYVQMQMGHMRADFTQHVYNRVRSWTGEREARVMDWMGRPERGERAA